MIIKRFFSRSVLVLNSKKLLSNAPILPKQGSKDQNAISQYFLDYKTSIVRGGNGGDGIVSFMHLKGNEYGGPDGGDGGNGANVVFKADRNVKSLNKLQSIFKAQNGENGMTCHMRGKNGKDLVVSVPVGTSFRVQHREQVEVELRSHDQMFVASRGGAGGKGNAYFLANNNRYPTQFELGVPGEEYTYEIQLNIIADAVLLGHPNVGKSSLLRVLTNSKPKVGDYSFTTLHPHVGVVDYEDFVQVSIADFPGILPDLTQGFGTRFFHHLDECKIFVFVVDLSREDAYEQFETTKRALEFYNPSLLTSKPVLIVGSKVDLVDNVAERVAEFKCKTVYPFMPISAEKRINLRKFLIVLRDIYCINSD